MGAARILTFSKPSESASGSEPVLTSLSALRAPAGEIGLNHALLLSIHLIRAVEFEIVSQHVRSRRGDENAVRLARCFQPRCDVNSVAPNVVGKFARADDSSHERTGMQSRTNRKRDRQ